MYFTLELEWYLSFILIGMDARHRLGKVYRRDSLKAKFYKIPKNKTMCCMESRGPRCGSVGPPLKTKGSFHGSWMNSVVHTTRATRKNQGCTQGPQFSTKYG